MMNVDVEVNARKNVLVVEDSEDSRLVVSEALSSDYVVTFAESAETACELLGVKDFSLVLLDLTLPKNDGYSVLSYLSKSPRNTDVPVMCLSSRSQVLDKVQAFDLGADDYVTKPFDVLELRARIAAKLKKNQNLSPATNQFSVGDIQFDLVKMQVALKEKFDFHHLELTLLEFKILLLLAKSPEKAFTRTEILDFVWDKDGEVFGRAVDVHVCSLRKKLGNYGDVVKSVHGVGYKFSTQHATL